MSATPENNSNTPAASPAAPAAPVNGNANADANANSNGNGKNGKSRKKGLTIIGLVVALAAIGYVGYDG
ncbi:MAG: hypothetical protein ABW220_04385 [Burkholderiaceae bacterium]